MKILFDKDTESICLLHLLPNPRKFILEYGECILWCTLKKDKKLKEFIRKKYYKIGKL